MAQLTRAERDQGLRDMAYFSEPAHLSVFMIVALLGSFFLVGGWIIPFLRRLLSPTVAAVGLPDSLVMATLFIVLMAGLNAPVMWYWTSSYRRRFWRSCEVLCSKCGYYLDLDTIRKSGVCPECGEPVHPIVLKRRLREAEAVDGKL